MAIIDESLVGNMKLIIYAQDKSAEEKARQCARLAQTLIVDALDKQRHEPPLPIPMLLWCPECGQRHIDRGEFATKPHETHACQNCGMVWKPAKVPTVGVRFLPGYHDGTHEIVTKDGT